MFQLFSPHRFVATKPQFVCCSLTSIVFMFFFLIQDTNFWTQRFGKHRSWTPAWRLLLSIRAKQITRVQREFLGVSVANDFICHLDAGVRETIKIRAAERRQLSSHTLIFKFNAHLHCGELVTNCGLVCLLIHTEQRQTIPGCVSSCWIYSDI